MSNSMRDIAEQAQVILVIGSNTTEQHPVFGTMLRQAVLRRKIPLIVADPRRIDLVEFASLHIRQNPGTDIALINGLMHIILENGWEDSEFILSRTENFEAFRETILAYTPERTSQITGVPIEDLQRAASLLGQNKPGAVIWAMGITQHTTGTANVLSLANLQMLLGNLGVPGGGVNPLRGQNNVQGACDMGGLPNVFPGYQAVTNLSVREKFEARWGAQLSPQVGRTVTEMVDGAGTGAIRALFILGENPVLSDPDTNHVRSCLEACELVILQEIFPSETAAFADILLPGVSFAEKSGTFTNTERRIQMVNPAVPPPGLAWQDWQITQEVSRRILEQTDRIDSQAQYANWYYQDTADVMAEIAAVTPIYAGVSHRRLQSGDQLQWPVKDDTHPGTPILHVEQFSRGLGLFSAVEHIPPDEMPDDEYPLILNTGRVLYHWHGGEMTRRAEALLEVYPRSLFEIHPEDARKYGVEDGAETRIASRRGSVSATAWITDRVPPGMVYANFHFPESPINELTNPALDPVAKIPEYKVCAVRIG